MRRYSTRPLAALLAAGALFAGCGDLTTQPTAASPAASLARQESIGGTDGPAALRLLECPYTGPDRRGIGAIGLFGGQLSAGGARMSAPLGAVLSVTLFETVVPASRYMEVEIHAVGLGSFLFQRPVNVTIDYSRCDEDAIPPGATPRAVYIDGETKEILEDMGGEVDRAARTITFSTGHLSGYAVAF
jgi:hypothetical protein